MTLMTLMTLIILIILALLIGVFLYWYLILRHGRMSFWKLAARNPDAAYHHIRSASCWKIFEGELPKNYRSIVPKSEWAGPFKLKTSLSGPLGKKGEGNFIKLVAAAEQLTIIRLRFRFPRSQDGVFETAFSDLPRSSALKI